jgi:transposase
LGASERNEEQRQAYREQLRGRRAEQFVILDESGTNLNLTPLYARAPRGQRAYGAVPRNTPPNTTLIASLTLAGMGPAMVLEGATDTAAFTAYVEGFLVPTLSPGQIVVMDNLSVHKSARVRTLIEGCGCELWYLPAYSPDLSPIELAFSKLKTLLRRAAARTSEALEQAIAQALEQITARDAHGWFAHCGYQSEAL